MNWKLKALALGVGLLMTTTAQAGNVNVILHAGYKGNRIINFEANAMHQAQPVSRECYQLRTCIVFKTTKKD